jgi:hypothetical protein
MLLAAEFPMRYCPIVLVVLSAAPAAHAVFDVTAEITFLRRPETTLEVFLYPDTEEDDRLNRFQLKLELEGGSPDGLHFSPVPRQTVFHQSLFPGVQFQDLGSDFDTLFVAAALPAGQGADVTDFRNGLLTAVVEVPDAFVPDRGSYPVRVDPSGTAFFDVDSQAVPFAASGGNIVIPEPSSAAICLAGVASLALRRRRR